MPRDKNTIEDNDTAGKGSYWMLDASANDMFEQGNYRRRRTRRQRQCLKTGTLLGESLKVSLTCYKRDTLTMNFCFLIGF